MPASQGVQRRLKGWDVGRACKSEACGQLCSLSRSLRGHTPASSLSPGCIKMSCSISLNSEHRIHGPFPCASCHIHASRDLMVKELTLAPLAALRAGAQQPSEAGLTCESRCVCRGQQGIPCASSSGAKGALGIGFACAAAAERASISRASPASGTLSRRVQPLRGSPAMHYKASNSLHGQHQDGTLLCQDLQDLT